MTQQFSTGTKGLEFTKGHGTGNDFVVVFDPDGSLDLSAERVSLLCDRHFGIGGDGILRVVPSSKIDFDAERIKRPSDPSLWFMDYRNADGSVAQMCGNGARVFAKYLVDHELVSDEEPFSIMTRGGVREVRLVDGEFEVNMGQLVVGPSGKDPVVRVGDQSWTGTAWWIPNPHVVVFVDDLDEAGKLEIAPIVDAPGRFDEGQNVEFAVDTSKETNSPSMSIRIHERGVGETQSCGTGACAAAIALRERHGITGPGHVDVTVPGGVLRVRIDDEGSAWLFGPARIVASGVTYI